MLLHSGGKRARSLHEDASQLWYPMWDAGFVLGHSVRTVKEALAIFGITDEPHYEPISFLQPDTDVAKPC